MDASKFQDKGIVWRGWSNETLVAVQENNRPVLLFVADPNTPDWPSLKAVFKEMPLNEKLRELLVEDFIALFIEARDLPEQLRLLGASSRFHIAVLSPYGLTPMVTINATVGSPGDVVRELACGLHNLRVTFRQPMQTIDITNVEEIFYFQ